MIMLLMTVISHVFSRLSCFSYFTSCAVFSFFKCSLHDSVGTVWQAKGCLYYAWEILTQPEEAQKLKKRSVNCKLIDIRSTHWHQHLPTICMYIKRCVCEKCSHNASPKHCGKMNYITEQSFPSKEGQFHTLQHHSSPLSGQSDIPIVPTCSRFLLLPCFVNSLSAYVLCKGPSALCSQLGCPN